MARAKKKTTKRRSKKKATRRAKPVRKIKKITRTVSDKMVIELDNPGKITVWKQGNRWRWSVFVDGKIRDSGSAASKSEAIRDAKSSKTHKMGPGKSTKKTSGAAWKTVQRRASDGSLRTYRWKPGPGRSVVVEYKRGKVWRSVINENVHEYFRRVREGARPKWPYDPERKALGRGYEKGRTKKGEHPVDTMTQKQTLEEALRAAKKRGRG